MLVARLRRLAMMREPLWLRAWEVCIASAGDHHTGQVDDIQQRLEAGDLIGLCVDFLLGHHDSIVVRHRSE
jgi:hypothetical protein